MDFGLKKMFLKITLYNKSTYLSEIEIVLKNKLMLTQIGSYSNCNTLHYHNHLVLQRLEEAMKLSSFIHS